jgi:hypothetical protein
MGTTATRISRNVPRQGYQFVVPVTPMAPAGNGVDVYALLAPDRARGEGLAAVETLERDRLIGGRTTLDRLEGESGIMCPSHPPRVSRKDMERALVSLRRHMATP